MPTTSSYYADLEYPTVNEDASTYGNIINIYLDGLLTKLQAISDRVTNAQTQLGNINRGVNAVDRVNTTLASAIGGSDLLPGTNITLLPDPYSGTYTKTTTWPAYTSELSSFSLPTTQAEIEAFDYEGFKDALLSELDRIEATVIQAEADILAAQKDTCRAKKYIDVYNSGGTVQTYYAGDTGGFNSTHIVAEFAISSLSGTSPVYQTAVLTFASGVPNDAGVYQINSYADLRSFCSAAGIPLDTDITLRNTPTGSSGYQGMVTGFGYLQPANSYTVNIGATNLTVSGGFYDSGGVSVGYLSRLVIQRYYTATRIVYGTPDLTECENPTPPYFS